MNDSALSLIVWLWRSVSSVGGCIVGFNKWQYSCCFIEPGCSSGVRLSPLYFMALIWTHVQGDKTHLCTYSLAHTYTADNMQFYSCAGNLEVNQNGVFYGWVYSLLQGTGFHTENANSMADVTQHTLMDTCSHMHAKDFIYFQGREGTQGLLLESTEAFYRTALRQGHCATQAHSDRSSLMPPYTPMGDNGKGGYILPRRRREWKKGRKKMCRRSRGIEAVSRSSVHHLSTPPSLCLILPLLCYLGGYVKHTHARTL